MTKCLFRLACGIIAAAEDSESYDTDDIEGQKIVTQSSVCPRQFIITSQSFLYDMLTCPSTSPSRF